MSPAGRLLLLVVAVGLLVAGPRAAWRASALEGAVVDARLAEWQAVEVRRLAPGSAASDVTSSGAFGDDDLSVEARVGWTSEALHLALEWHDDVVQAPVRRRSDAIWTAPDGSRRDAMYLSDNVKIQVRTAERNYTVWLSPHAAEDAPYQWHAVRNAKTREALETGRPASARARSAGSTTLEVALPWQDMALAPAPDVEIELILIVTDGDAALEQPDAAAFDGVKHLSWRGRVRLTSALPSSREVIERAIGFHDPDGRWSSWRAAVELVFENPDGERSSSRVRFDNMRGFYEWRHTAGGTTVLTGVDGDRCFALGEDGAELDEAFREANDISCANTKKMRNYHTYLYGLPMKLVDPGTRYEDPVKRLELNGKPYLVVRVPYEEDVWDFFIDPGTHALEAYRFYKDEATRLGEIIYLEGLETIEGIRLPKRRSWYNTHDDAFVGTDIVAPGSGFDDHP